ncbi:hypothetical protein FXO37_08820 [Capsicum annuum]|nr:hypothetical protein FXO37_08820 [Capsicum annuum]
MEGSVTDDLGAPPESWEVADLDASMRRLILSSSSKKNKDNIDSSSVDNNNNNNNSDQSELLDSSGTGTGGGGGGGSGSVSSEDVVNTVDQFLREALQNPRERLSVASKCVISYVVRTHGFHRRTRPDATLVWVRTRGVSPIRSNESGDVDPTLRTKLSVVAAREKDRRRV